MLAGGKRVREWMLTATISIVMGSSAWANAAPAMPTSMPDPKFVSHICQTIILAENTFPLEERDDWEKKSKRFDGLKFDRSGVHVRKKDVNHGLWKHYKISMHDPKQDLLVEIRRFQHMGGDRFEFEIFIRARIVAYAHLMQWNKGLRVISTEIEADASIELTFKGSIRVNIGRNLLLPTVSIDPNVDQATINLGYFRMKRIGQFDGVVIKELGESLEKYIRRKVREQSANITNSANQAIAKQRQSGKLQFSMKELWPK